jgi:hypothetical protein
VLYTSNPVAGEEIGPAVFVAVKATLGIKIPLSVAETSSFAETSGLLTPIPTCAKMKVGRHRAVSKIRRD